MRLLSTQLASSPLRHGPHCWQGVAEITATLIRDIEFALEDFEHYDLKRKVET